MDNTCFYDPLIRNYEVTLSCKVTWKRFRISTRLLFNRTNLDRVCCLIRYCHIDELWGRWYTRYTVLRSHEWSLTIPSPVQTFILYINKSRRSSCHFFGDVYTTQCKRVNTSANRVIVRNDNYYITTAYSLKVYNIIYICRKRFPKTRLFHLFPVVRNVVYNFLAHLSYCDEK